MKNKKYVYIFTILAVIVLVVCFAYMAFSFEIHTWELKYVTRYDFSDDPTSFASDEVEVTLTAKNGKITITDKTNNKTYEGTYKRHFSRKSSNGYYTIEIDGKNGSINYVTTNHSEINMTIDGYSVIFGKK
ncbi:MAG: hypothetical protein E7593_01620 [Ruminococcaceae bacterium]|nr:hypothetical protein [Oscillospiraceae bacterium]